MSFPEILAPAGSVDALKAAVHCGAAAVYLGTDAFNARQHAQNFAGDALKEAVAFCHLHNVKVYLTLNTLIREKELPNAVKVATFAQECGVDALILQDLGLAHILREVLPDIPLHASTQLSCHSPAGVRFLKENGFSRVVLSREMTLEEIRACVDCGCELEVFVHGALCMCVSGQCYLSAMLGGRSGNRGLCAQPCRLPFAAQDTPQLTNGYALSLKDMSHHAYITDLAKAGVVSFKIEGRMKRPEYVAAAVTVCRQAALGEPVAYETLQDLEAVFSRSGFTDGYITNQRGTDMFGIRRHEDVQAASAVLKKLALLYAKTPQHIRIDIQLTAAPSQPTTVTVSDTDGHTVTITGEAAQVAVHRATDPQKIIEQLQKTGGTPYCATAHVSVTPDTMLPLSVINALRREALEKLDDLRIAIPKRRVLPYRSAKSTKKVNNFTDVRIIRLQSHLQYDAFLQNETVVLPHTTPVSFWKELATTHKGRLGIDTPRGLFENADTVREQIACAAASGAAFALCSNINAIELVRSCSLPFIADFGFNVTNRQTIEVLKENGAAAILLSPELSFLQTEFAKSSDIPCGLITYGRMPLMLTRNCPYKSAGGRCFECKAKHLVDRKGAQFPFVCDNGCTELLNSVPTYWADKPSEIPQHTFEMLQFTIESPDEIQTILKMHDQHKTPDFPFTRGMYRKGVE